MKKVKGFEEENMDSYECSQKLSTCVNIRYHLRSRNIYDCEKNEAQNTEKDISLVQEANKRFMCEPSIMMFPTEVLMKIFSYLNVCELSKSVAPVCKHWHRIAHSPILWRKLCFEGARISTESAISLLKKSPHLSELVISNRSDVEEILSHVCDNNRDVESVAITRSGGICGGHWGFLSTKDLDRLSFFCPKIQTLKLNYMHLHNDGFYDNLGIHLPKLTCLHLTHSITLTPQHIKNIATNCCNLAQFWLSGEDFVHYHGDWEDAYSTLFQQNWRTLTHLQLDAYGLRDEAFKDLSLCTNLKYLHLNRAVELSSVGLNAIGVLPNLISLQLHEVTDLHAPTFLNSVHQNENLINLVNLSLAGSAGIDDAFAFFIILQCPNIHMLTLANVQGFTDYGLQIILTECSLLHYLDIYGMKNITGSSFACIPQHAHKLNFLVIEDFCNRRKEENLKALLRLSPRVQVHRIHRWKTCENFTCRLLQ